MSQIHCVRQPSTISMTTDDPVIQEACRQSFHNHGQMVELLGKKYICMNYMGGGNEFVLREIFIVQPSKPEVAPWNGEGLPPVGTVCEWHPNQDGWVQVEILGHSGEETWFRREGHESSETCLRMTFFRPIRTPEQIAAEEREKAAEDLYLTINWDSTPSEWANLSRGRREDYFKAIDAGYRKFEIVEGE